MPVRVPDVFGDLLAKRAVADGLESALEVDVANVLVRGRNIHLSESLGVAEDMVVDNAREAVELHEVVLKRRRGKKKLLASCQGVFELVTGHVAWLVDIAQAVSLVHDHKVPRNGANLGILACREIVGADDDGIIDVEWVDLASSLRLVERARLHQSRIDEKLIGKLLSPLHAQ